MQSLDKIKRRIKTVQTTSKITGAMKLVATAKIKKQMNEFKMVSDFCQDFYKIIEDLAKLTSQKNFSQQKKSGVTSKLWIIVTSSLGLCGAFNINACKHLISLCKPEDEIIVIGRKGFSYLKSHGLEGQIIDFMEMSEAHLNYLELLPTSELIMNLYNEGDFASVHIVYTKFINSITFTPTDLQVLPLDYSLFKAETKNQDSDSNSSYVTLTDDHKELSYDPSVDNILLTCLPIYLTTMMFATIAESKVCENGARRNAMETATDNAKQLIEDLTLQFNRARQENITQEINEIVAGAGS